MMLITLDTRWRVTNVHEHRLLNRFVSGPARRDRVGPAGHRQPVSLQLPPYAIDREIRRSRFERELDRTQRGGLYFVEEVDDPWRDTFGKGKARIDREH